MSLRNYHEVIFLLIVLLLFLIGFFGPQFWKIPQPSFNFKVIKNNIGNSLVSVTRLNQFHSNKNYLSSDQFENKQVVLQWSELILNNAKNDVFIPRMYFPNIPKNINQYKNPIF